MSRTARIGLLALVVSVLAPGAVAAAIPAEEEKTTVTLIGVDGKGNFTILLKQTQTNTNDVVFVVDLAVTSNYDYEGCKRAQGPLAPVLNIEDKCARNLDRYVFVIEEPTVACGQVQVAGGDAPDFRVIDLGNIGGTFRFDYQTFTQADRMVLRCPVSTSP